MSTTLGAGVLSLLFLSGASAATYQVGPTRAKKTLPSVATLLNPGDVVEVDGDVTYTNAVSFNRSGTMAAPITVRGLRVNGRRPILSGTNVPGILGLVTFRGNHYRFEGFELDGAFNPQIARGLYHVADDVTVYDTLVHNFAFHGIHGSDSAGSLTLDRVEVCHSGSGLSYHQVYVASDNVTHSNAVFRMQFCYLHDGNGGNNVKSRAGRNEIYYNWIEGAAYHELDLIGADQTAQSPNTADLVREDSDVTGNILCKQSSSLGSIARLGTDGTGSSNGRYRFVNNTVVLPADFSTYAIRVRGRRESVELHNNVFARRTGGALQFVDSTEPSLGGDHRVSGANNWLPANSTGIPSGLTNTRFGPGPRFTDAAAFAFTPTNASPLLDAAQLPTSSPPDHPFPAPLPAPLFLPPLRTPPDPGPAVPRPDDGELDIGALEAPSLAPAILTQPAGATKLQGQTVTFSATAGGSLTDSNPLSYQWSLDGVPLPGATNGSLPFAAVETNDAGSYTLTVTNAFGSDTSSDAALVVNPDTNKPSVTIASPPDKTVFTADAIVLSGTASDNARVSGVFVSRGGTNHWQPVASINQPTPNSAGWTHPLTLAVGTNRIFIKSVDFAGGESTPAGRSVFFSVRSPLALQTNGAGAILSPAQLAGTPTNEAMLEISRTFTVTAVPAANWMFSNWLASANGGPFSAASAAARYPFTMQTNLALVAQFVTNRFLEAAGRYCGLFSESNHISHRSAGYFSAKITAAVGRPGTFSGRLSLAGETAGFSGTFNLAGDGMALRPVIFFGRSDALTVRLCLPFDGSDTISGSVSNNDGSWVALLNGNRAVFKTANPATAYAGQYTMLIPGSTNAAEAPGGDGFGTVNVANGGTISLLGNLGGGTLLRQSVPVSKWGDWPFYSPAATVNGTNASVIMGWLSFSNGLGGTVAWVRLAQAGEVYYPQGFSNETEILGSRYTKPATGVRAIALANGNGLLLLRGGNLPQTLSNNVTLSTLNKFVAGTNYGLSLQVATATGKLTGAYTNAATGNLGTPLTGVVLQQQNVGGGFFNGTNETGALLLRGN